MSTTTIDETENTGEGSTKNLTENPSKKRCRGMLGVTVEPVLFIHNIASSLMWITSQDLMMEKTCRVNYGFSEEICSDFNNNKGVKELVSNFVSNILMWRSIFETSIKVVWVLYLGSWSDRCGRKLPLMISLVGLCGEAGVYLGLYFFSSWPVETVLLASISYSLSGGTHALLMICFSSIADMSSKTQRTLRVGLLDGAYYLGSPVGMALLNPLRDWGGYVSVFSFVVIIYIMALVYIALTYTNKQQESDRPAVTGGCGECGFNDLTDAFRATFRHREYRVTAAILVLILAMLCDSLPVWGAGNVKYLFTEAALNWTHVEYSNWGTLSSFMTVFGALILVPLFTKLIKIQDLVIAMIGAISRCASNIMYGVVTKPSQGWVMYTGAVVASAAPLCPIGIRSLLSKLSGPHEVGKVYAVMATLECFLPFIAAPIYNKIFTSSPNLPGSYNFFSAGMNILIIIYLGIVKRLHARNYGST